jgi:hypothetical protein
MMKLNPKKYPTASARRKRQDILLHLWPSSTLRNQKVNLLDARVGVSLGNPVPLQP